jgi:hypothetical protein
MSLGGYNNDNLNKKNDVIMINTWEMCLFPLP